MIGVLLAAGRSSRMGRTKQLLPWPGDTTMVAAAFDAIAGACGEMVVVLDHDAEAIVAALGGRRFHRVDGDGGDEMFESLRAGLAPAVSGAPTSPVIVHLADHPAVEPRTVERLAAALDADPARAVIPTFEGRGGHPVVLPAGLAAELLHHHGTGGLRGYWIEHPDRCVRLAVDDPGVTIDIDRPDDARGGVAARS